MSSDDNVVVLVVESEVDKYGEEISPTLDKLLPQKATLIYGHRLEDFTRQMPQLPAHNRCMVLWAAGDPRVVASLFQHYGMDKLSWVHSLSAGVDSLVPVLVSDNLADKITLTNARGAFSKSLAEYSLMCMLHFNKKVPMLQRLQKDKVWRKFRMPVLRGKTVGFVGFGSIAQETAKVCRPLGMRILALRSRIDDGPGSDLADEVLNSGVLEQKNKLFRESDFVICSLPGTPSTRHFCGSHEFALMRPTSVFISIGRGVCVDEVALYKALSTPHRGPAS
ncbi:Glyoxylate reductase, putative, partial [Perkinsus marinus ATCC 50983]